MIPFHSKMPGNRVALISAVGFLLGACAPTGYYVANIYRDNNELYVQRCPIYASGKYGDSSQLSSKDCNYERVQDLPSDVRAALSGPAR